MGGSAWEYELCVIGAGSGGVRAARMAASAGLKVALVESHALGGTCVNVGCIPKKLLVYASHFHEDFDDASGYGWTLGERNFDWARLRAAKDAEVARLNGVYRKLLEKAGVELVEGRARLLDEHTVGVGARQIRAKTILVATGCGSYVPNFPGREFVLDSDAMFRLEHLPGRIIIVGGGYIAVEFAGIMQGLGVETSLVYRGEQVLRGFDAGIRTFLGEEMHKKGIRLLSGQHVERVERAAGGELMVSLQSGARLSCDAVLYATGRRAATKGLGLEELGVLCRGAAGWIEVDPYYRTSVPSIYALGDVIGGMQLTPVALAEAMVFVRNLLAAQAQETLAYENIATAVFSQPPVATVGLSEEEASERYEELAVFESSFKPLRHTLSGRAERTFMKMIVEGDSARVVGVHMVGPDAGEIIQGIAVAMVAGARKSDFDRTIGIHPTSAEEFVTMREPVRVKKKQP